MLTPEEKISSLIETQFPAVFREDGPKFIAFVKAYYEWLELEGNAGERSQKLRDYRDIDKTIDDFLVYFKNKYLVDFPFPSTANKRLVIKHAIDIYRSKGTEAAIKLVFRLLFNDEASVYLPSDDIIKASDGAYVIPQYLELEPNSLTPNFIGKEVIGATSGARAYADRLDRRFYKGLYIDQLFISNVRGNFIRGEVVTEDGDIEDKPIVVGSATTLELTTVGRDFVVGETLKLASERKGRLGKAVVREVGEDTGQVLFTIDDGGYGYVRQRRDINGAILEKGSSVYIANNMFSIANISHANTSLTVSFNANSTGVSVVNHFITIPDNGLLNGDLIRYSVPAGNTAIANLTSNSSYFITQANSSGVKLSNIPNGDVIQIAPGSNETHSLSLITKRFVPLERAVQYKAQFDRGGGLNLWNNGAPPVGTYIVGGNSSVNCAFGYVVSISGSNNSQVTVTSIDDSFNLNAGTAALDRLYSSNSTSGATTATSLNSNSNLNVYGIVTGQNSTHIGFHSITGNGTFVGYFANSGVENNFVRGLTSNTYCQLRRKYTGQNANFEIGVITNQERIYVATDFVGGNNFADGVPGPGIPYLNIKIANTVGYQSGVGLLAGVTIVDGGSGYVVGDPLTVTGGSPTSSAVLKVGAESGGVITAVNIVSTGYGYDSAPTISGGDADIQPVMSFGYGFPKLPYGGYNNIINECLTRETINVGTIAILTRVNPGEQYNISPFVYVIEPRTAGYQKKDVRLQVQNITKPFIVGEFIQQTYFEPAQLVSFNTFVAGKSVANVTIVDDGTGYANGDPVFFTGGTGTGALGSITTDASGNVTAVSIVYAGRGYSTPITATVGTVGGSSASFTVSAVNTSFIDGETVYQQQYRTTLTISGWSSGVPNVGANVAGSNSNPTEIANNGVVLLANSTVVVVGSVSNVFANTTSVNLIVANVVSTNATGGQTNAIVTGVTGVVTANIYGQVIDSTLVGTSGNAVIQFQTNEYYSNVAAPLRGVNAFNNGSTITGLSSASTANVSYNTGEPSTVENAFTSVVNKGQIIGFSKNEAANVGVINLKRLSFNLAFSNLTIQGSLSGAEATLVEITNIDESRPIGLNADIIANTSAASNTLVNVEVINSGLGYQQDEIVNLVPEGTNRFIASARVNVTNQGIAEGYFRNNQGFLNSDKYIHDNDYYQEYSYEVRAGLSLDKYASVLKNVLHVAGSKYFGNVVKVVDDILQIKSVANTDTTQARYFFSNSTSVVPSTNTTPANNMILFNNAHPNTSLVFANDNLCMYVREAGNTANVGLVNNSLYYVRSANTSGVKLAYVDGSIAGFTITSGGTGYKNTSIVTLISNTGSGAFANVTTDGTGTITSVNLITTGKNYQNTTTISVSNGTSASITVIVKNNVNIVDLSTSGNESGHSIIRLEQ